MKTVKVEINWILSRERIPPVISNKERFTYNSYSPLIFFKNQNSIPQWSAVIFNEKITGKKSKAFMTFLSELAPYELLQIGAEFELYEGRNIVAYGVIIEEER